MTRIAYVILAHRLPQQLVRLVERLDAPGATFLIHVNRRSDDAVLAATRTGLAGRGNVIYLRRHRLYWGGFGHVAATVEGLEELRRRSVAYDYVALLTGQDYPIKPPAEIARTLAAGGGRSFIAHDRVPGGVEDGMRRITHWHERRIGRPRGWHLSVPLRRRFPEGLEPWGGSAYWWLSREAAEHVRAWIAGHPRAYRFFRHVDVPDEVLFQTILMNSPLRDAVIDDELRLVDWTRRPMPWTFRAQDLPLLRDSPKLVARKFDVTVDAEILDLVDRELLGLP
jgi:hypothetical protein